MGPAHLLRVCEAEQVEEVIGVEAGDRPANLRTVTLKAGLWPQHG